MRVRRLLVIVWVLLVGLFLGGLLLAALLFGGYRGIKLGMYLARYPDKQGDAYRDVVREFAGTLTENEVSGFLVGADHKHVWLWTLNGLESFVVSEVIPAFYVYTLCGQNKASGLAQKIEPVYTTGIERWRSLIHPGDYVQMRYFYNDAHGRIRLVDKAWAYDADLWMEDTIERQCGRL